MGSIFPSLPDFASPAPAPPPLPAPVYAPPPPPRPRPAPAPDPKPKLPERLPEDAADPPRDRAGEAGKSSDAPDRDTPRRRFASVVRTQPAGVLNERFDGPKRKTLLGE